MSDRKVYIGAVNVVVMVSIADLDISNSTSRKFVVRKPESGEVEWDNITVVGSSVLRYITQADDLDEAGMYYLQPWIEIGGWAGYGSSVSFRIYKRWR